MDPPRQLVNGDSLPRTETIKGGVRHRFRFLNIGPAAPARLRDPADSTVQQWRLVAKDGADVGAVSAISGVRCGRRRRRDL